MAWIALRGREHSPSLVSSHKEGLIRTRWFGARFVSLGLLYSPLGLVSKMNHQYYFYMKKPSFSFVYLLIAVGDLQNSRTGLQPPGQIIQPFLDHDNF